MVCGHNLVEAFEAALRQAEQGEWEWEAAGRALNQCWSWSGPWSPLADLRKPTARRSSGSCSGWMKRRASRGSDSSVLRSLPFGALSTEPWFSVPGHVGALQLFRLGRPAASRPIENGLGFNGFLLPIASLLRTRRLAGISTLCLCERSALQAC